MNRREPVLWVVVMAGVMAGVMARSEEASTHTPPTALREQMGEVHTGVLNDTRPKHDSCSTPFFTLMGQCFYLHQWVPNLSWDDARAFCRNAGGDLAQPKHFGSLVIYLYKVLGIAQTVFDLYEYSIWVGGQQEAGEAMVWLSGKAVETWSSGAVEPQQSTERFSQRRCLAMALHREGLPGLVPYDCSRGTYHFMCEIRV